MKAKKMSTLVLFLLPIGVAMNFIGYQLATLLKLPLTIDAIGTIVVGATCGPLAGAIVGLVTNLINAISVPTSAFYAPISILFGIAAGMLARKRVFTHFLKTLLTFIVFAALGAGLGTGITWVVYGFDWGTHLTHVLLGIPLHEVYGLPIFLAQLLSALVFDSVDKIITVLAVFFILKSLPLRYLTKLPYGKYFLDKDDHNNSIQA
ncbi:ECF transporter S component [Bacillus sp. JJ1562]|uniref:ECF transporter S component n=1 Tax=Bacillus sp. JJ1562 TaxID=3122960 RepID=UPI0030029EE9